MRWRAPLWIAEVDTEKRRLIQSTERIVLPTRGDAETAPEMVARMGNFHTINVRGCLKIPIHQILGRGV